MRLFVREGSWSPPESHYREESRVRLHVAAEFASRTCLVHLDAPTFAFLLSPVIDSSFALGWPKLNNRRLAMAETV